MADDNPNNQIENNGKELVRDDHGRVVSGVLNPDGRPLKGYSITETIKKMMQEKPEIKKALSTKILQAALNGDMAAIRLLWSYMDGMPKITQELTGSDGQPINIRVIAGNDYLPPTRSVDGASEGSIVSTPQEVQGAGVAQKSKENDNSGNTAR